MPIELRPGQSSSITAIAPKSDKVLLVRRFRGSPLCPKFYDFDEWSDRQNDCHDWRRFLAER